MPWNSPEVLDELMLKVNHGDSPYDLSEINIRQFSQRDQRYCTTILSYMAVAYCPMLGVELIHLVDLPKAVSPVLVVNRLLLGFLRTFEGRVYFRHQSARDFIRQRLSKPGLLKEHSNMA